MNKVYFVLGKGSYLDQPLADKAFRLVDRQPLIPEYPEVTLPSKYKFACQTRLPPSLLYGYLCRLSRLRADYILDANDKHQCRMWLSATS